jgi:hypothetical protein
MKPVIVNSLIASMSATYFLLAYQAEVVTRTFGIIFGTLLALALIVQLFRRGDDNA